MHSSKPWGVTLVNNTTHNLRHYPFATYEEAIAFADQHRTAHCAAYVTHRDYNTVKRDSLQLQHTTPKRPLLREVMK